LGKHSATRSSTYFSTHVRCLEGLKNSGLVTSETLAVTRLEQGNLRLQGRVICRGGFILTVNKILKASKSQGVEFVQAVKYSYHLTDSQGKDIFRYDNAHAHEHLGHQSSYHVHRFDSEGNEFAGSPYEIPDLQDWPTLSEVLGQADCHYWDQYSLTPPSLEL